MSRIRDYILSHDHVTIGGNGTRGAKGDISADNTGIIQYAPDELYVTIGAAMPISELEAVLAERNQMMAFEPMDHRIILHSEGEPTIGGALGVNADGPRRLRFGAMRDAVLGLSFVDGQGETIRTGGIVMKNVTGLDLTKLFVGSRGRLGVATEITLKVLPRPASSSSYSFELDPLELVEKMGKALRSPFDISGAIYRAGRLYLRQEGADVDALRDELFDQLGQGREEDLTIWRAFRDWDDLATEEEIWRVVLRPTQSIAFAIAIDAPSMTLCGGSQVVVGAVEDAVLASLPEGAFAIREKGGHKRLPAPENAHQILANNAQKVFDPNGKFGGIYEN